MGNLKYKDSHKKLGICCDCSRIAEPDKRRCLRHLKRKPQKEKADVEKRKG